MGAVQLKVVSTLAQDISLLCGPSPGLASNDWSVWWAPSCRDTEDLVAIQMDHRR